MMRLCLARPHRLQELLCYTGFEQFAMRGTDEVNTTRKSTKEGAQKNSRNGAQATKQPRRSKQAPQLSEKAKKLALKAFRLTYEAHHGKSS